MKETELKESLLQDDLTSSTLELAQTTMPMTDDRLQRFLEQAGLTEEDLAEVGIKNPELLLALLTPSWQRYLRLGQWDKLAFKLMMLPFMGKRDVLLSQQPLPSALARVWPRSTALLFERPRVLMQAYMTTDFLKGTQFAADILLSGVIYSLMTMELVNVGTCPQNYPVGDIFKLLVGYSNPLSGLLTDVKYWPYLAALLPGIPLLWGGSKGLIAALDARPINRPRLNQILKRLENFQPHYLQDTIGWLVPLSPLSRVHKHITRVLMWDGRPLVTPEKRMKLGEALCENARQSRQLTRLNAIGSLADMVDGIALRDIVYLQQLGVNKETLLATLFTQQRALEELRYQADNYPLDRYVYANYRLWQLGQPSKRLLQPGFWALEALRAYARLSLVAILLKLVVDAIDKAVKKQACLSQGKQWAYIDSIRDFNCTVCPDLDLFYPETWTAATCFEGNVRERRTVTQLIFAIKRFKLSNIKALTLTHHGLNNTELGFVLQALKETNTTVEHLEVGALGADFTDNTMSLEEAQRVGDSLPSLQLRSLLLKGRGITVDSLQAIAPALVATVHLKVLNMSYNPLGDHGLQILANYNPPLLEILDFEACLIQFTEVNLNSLLHGSLKRLNLSWNVINETGMQRLGQQVATSRLKELDIRSNQYKGSSITPLLSQLPWATLEQLGLGHNGLSTKDLLPLLSVLNQTNLRGVNLGINSLDEYGARLLAQQLPRSSLTNLELTLNPIGEDGLIAIVEQLEYVALQYLGLFGTGMTDSSLIALGQQLPQSAIRSLTLGGNRAITDEGLSIFLQTAVNASLEFLELNGNNIGDIGALALSDYLPRSMLKMLYIQSNQITAQGVMALAQHLTVSHLIMLDLSGNQINDTGIVALAKALPRSSVINLNLSGNSISSEGAKVLAQALAQPLCSSLIPWGLNLALNKGTPRTNLTLLKLGRNRIDTIGARDLCEVLPFTHIPIQGFDINDNPIDESIVDINTCHITQPIASATTSLRAPWPYLLLYRTYETSRQFLWPALPPFTFDNEQAHQDKLLSVRELSLPSLQNMAAYGALYLSVGYALKEGMDYLTSWWQDKTQSIGFLPHETFIPWLDVLQQQSQQLKTKLEAVPRHRLTADQQELLTILQHNQEDSEALLVKHARKGRGTHAQLQELEEDFAYIASQFEEVSPRPVKTNLSQRFGFFPAVPVVIDNNETTQHRFTKTRAYFQ